MLKKTKLYSQKSEQELIALISLRNEMAFGELYQRYFSVLYLHARHMLHNSDHARDVVQEIFTALWVNAEMLEPAVQLKSYLYKATRNSVLNIIRKEKHEGDYINALGNFYDKGEFSTDAAVNLRELQQQFDKETALLPIKMRKVFEMSRQQYLSYAEIAEELGISSLTVKKQISKALHILRHKLAVHFR